MVQYTTSRQSACRGSRPCPLRTCILSASFSVRCSSGTSPSRATARSPSPRSTSNATRTRHLHAVLSCRSGWTRSCSVPWRKTPPGAILPHRQCVTISYDAWWPTALLPRQSAPIRRVLSRPDPRSRYASSVARGRSAGRPCTPLLSAPLCCSLCSRYSWLSRCPRRPPQPRRYRQRQPARQTARPPLPEPQRPSPPARSPQRQGRPLLRPPPRLCRRRQLLHARLCRQRQLPRQASINVSRR